jgi:nonsense-mediated mRNA decay protein 3
MDIHTSTKSYKFTYAVELIPICKDDLVALPMKLAKHVGNISPLTLCYRIGTSINLLDPNTLQTADVSPVIYWRTPFVSIADIQELVEFIVMDVDVVGPTKGRWALAEATVARASDLGVNDNTYFCRTHLGNIVHAGDSVLGYHLTGTNFNNSHFEALEQSSSYASTIPDVMLVKKFYSRKKKSKNRNWRLKRMDKDEGELLPKKQDQERMDRDFEMFLQDIEEDTEMRSTIALYKAQQKKKQVDEMEVEAVGEMDEDDGEDDIPQINMDELLDEFEELHMEDE